MKRLGLYVLLFVVVFLLSGWWAPRRTPIDEPPEGFVLVEGGMFVMGDEFGDLPDWNRPACQVMLTYDFWMGKYPVTFDEFDAFCNDTGRSEPRDQGWGRGTRPVIWVTWWDAIAYCNWLSEKEVLPVAYRLLGEPDEGQMLDASGNVTTDITKAVGYRLPTEAEWEYAARGGKHQSPYKVSGSDSIDEVAWYRLNAGMMTQEVGSKLPNELGIYDMSGNVWEWCSDRWYDYTDTPKTNPYEATDHYSRMLRGGSWLDFTAQVRIARRASYPPSYADRTFGFRVARTAP